MPINGKALKALLKVKRDIADKAVKEADDIAKLTKQYKKLPMKESLKANTAGDNFILKGTPYEKGSILVPENSQVPMTLPKSSVPSVIPEIVTDIPKSLSTIPVSKLPISINKNIELSNLAKLGLGTAGIGAGVLALNNNENEQTDNEQPVTLPDEKVSASPVQKQDIAAKLLAIKNKVQPNISTQSQIQQIVPPKDFRDLEYEKAQQVSNENLNRAILQEALAKLSNSAIRMGAGGQLNIPDESSSIFQKLQQFSNLPVQQLEAKRKQQSELMDLNLQKEKNDVNSSISKLYRDTLKTLDPSINTDGLTGAQIEKTYPAITQAINAKENREARLLQARELAANKIETTNEKKLYKERDSIDRLWKNIQSGENYKLYSRIDEVKDALNSALGASPGDDRKIAAGQAFMIYGKIAQGDSSVLRESDIKNLAGNMGYTPAQMINKLQEKARGGQFTDGELKAMIKVMDAVKRAKGNRLNNDLAPLKKRAEKVGYDLSESVPSDFLGIQETNKQDSKIEAYAKQHNLSYDVAEKLLRSRGYGK